MTAATAQDMRNAFAVFDKDNSGTISASELAAILTRPGGAAPLTQSDAEAFIEQFDVNGDGMLSFDEFCAMWAARSAPPPPPPPLSPGSPHSDRGGTPADWAKLNLPPELGAVAGYAPDGGSCSAEGVVTTDAFVVTVAIAQGDLFAEDLGDAVAEYMDLYDDAEGIAPEQLDDGWLFTASGGAGAHVVMARRLVAGTVYSVSASLDTEERQEAAVLFAKSLRHG